jgi:hypothetical protein
MGINIQINNDADIISVQCLNMGGSVLYELKAGVLNNVNGDVSIN